MFLPYFTTHFTTLMQRLLNSHLQECLRLSTCLFSVSDASYYLPLNRQSLQYKMQIQIHCNSDPQNLPYSFRDKMKCLSRPHSSTDRTLLHTLHRDVHVGSLIIHVFTWCSHTWNVLSLLLNLHSVYLGAAPNPPNFSWNLFPARCSVNTLPFYLP